MKKTLKGGFLSAGRTKTLSGWFLVALVLICLVSTLAGAVFYRYGYVNKEIVLGQIRELLKGSGNNQVQLYPGMKMEIAANQISTGQFVAEISYRGISDSVEILLVPNGKPGQIADLGDGKFYIKSLQEAKAFELIAVSETASLDNWLMMSFARFNGIKVQNTGFVKLFINGESIGLFHKIDQLDSMLFPSRAGMLARLNDLYYDYKVSQGIALNWDCGAIPERNSKSNLDHRPFIDKLNALFLDDSNAGNIQFQAEQVGCLLACLYYLNSTVAVKPAHQFFFYDDSTKLVEIGLTGGANISEFGLVNYKVLQSGLFKKYLENQLIYDEFMNNLRVFSSESYLNSFFADIEQEFNFYHSMMQQVAPAGVKPYKKFFYKNRKILEKICNPEYAIHTMGLSVDGETVRLDVCNLQEFPVIIDCIILGENQKLFPVEEQLNLLPAKKAHQATEYIEFEFESRGVDVDSIDLNQLQIEYHLKGTDKAMLASILPIGLEQVSEILSSPTQHAPNYNSFEFIEEDTNAGTITFKPGCLQIDRPLVIPDGFLVKVDPATEIDLVNSALILSYSALEFRGTESEPVKLYSSDNTSLGLVVIGSNKPSVLEHVHFTGLLSPDIGAWQLTGAVTFYRTGVTINSCVFESNLSEDALNIVSSDMEIAGTVFRNNLSDAFDGDFVRGSLKNCMFVDCGNDAIDLSGSEVSISNVSVNRAGDKGLSVGERSEVHCKNISISNAELAITSKDNSLINIVGLDVKNCKVGLTAYQKKSEYGPGNILVSEYTQEKVDYGYLLEQGSSIVLEQEPLEYNHHRLRDIFYGVEFGKSSK